MGRLTDFVAHFMAPADDDIGWEDATDNYLPDPVKHLSNEDMKRYSTAFEELNEDARVAYECGDELGYKKAMEGMVALDRSFMVNIIRQRGNRVH